ncbi:TetR/AcrR family transcriptional regulator [Albimonas pacifica]|uniref:Transcriptional regulator, TetR family n=1 Tax=Albimonas pacifica TaxID=1114924 RepID=A0A1I3FVF7_9RHOB|nr:TetR/AcrR family transcriptional regulator [Albimonas pacifica]SFI14911.1 transcriptional regulator, TetR family [Albimonas pacifica]
MILFWRKGFEATSISDLTQAMGIGSPSLYAAFGSKEALYVEALRHYRDSFDPSAWDRLEGTRPVRAAIERYLNWSADRLTGAAEERPSGCMVTLSSVSRDEHPELHDLMRSEREVNLTRLKARLEEAVSSGELPRAIDVHGLARFVQTVQFGMSILARDGATRDELRAVVQHAMGGWDARVAEAGQLPERIPPAPGPNPGSKRRAGPDVA